MQFSATSRRKTEITHCSCFPGTLLALSVLKGRVPMSSTIRLGTLNVPGLSRSHKFEISDNDYNCSEFDTHGSVHRRWFSRNINKMQLCNRIYYSKVYWTLNIRSSKLCLQPLVYIHIWWPVVATQPWRRPVTTCVYKPEAANAI